MSILHLAECAAQAWYTDEQLSATIHKLHLHLLMVPSVMAARLQTLFVGTCIVQPQIRLNSNPLVRPHALQEETMNRDHNSMRRELASHYQCWGWPCNKHLFKSHDVAKVGTEVLSLRPYPLAATLFWIRGLAATVGDWVDIVDPVSLTTHCACRWHGQEGR